MTSKTKEYEVLSAESKKGSKKAVKVKVSKKVVEHFLHKELNNIAKSIQIKGFRKGKAPLSVVIKNVDFDVIINKAHESVISHAHKKFIAENKLDPIGYPQIKSTKGGVKDKDNVEDLEYEIEFYVIPQIKLPNYKSIAKKVFKGIKEQKITKKELEEEKEKVQREIFVRKLMQDKKKTFEEANNQALKLKSKDLPKLTKENLQLLGFDLDEKEFEEKLKESIKTYKAMQEKNKQRAIFLEELDKATDIDVPEILIALEQQNMLQDLETRLHSAGINMEEYLKHEKTTMEKLMDRFKKEAKTVVKLNLILPEIAKKENVFPTPAEVQAHVEQLLKTNKNLDPTHAYNIVLQHLINEKVFSLFEKNSSSKKENKNTQTKTAKKK